MTSLSSTTSITSKTITRAGYSVTVAGATVKMGLTRRKLAEQAIAAAGGLDDPGQLFLSHFTYPDLIACAVSNSGFTQWPPSFEEYLNLPEKFAYEWEAACYDLNPHWLPAATREQETQKTTADTLHQRLSQMLAQRKESQQASPELPDRLNMHDLETSWRVWLLMEATGWQFPPSVLMNEQDWLLDDLLVISTQKALIEKMLSD